MDELETLFSYQPKKLNFRQRKLPAFSDRTLLYGPPFCGKTTLLINELISHNQKAIYIDLNDRRLDQELIAAHLERFIADQSIEFLAIDNYKKEFAIPTNISKVFLASGERLDIESFDQVQVGTLDFEEFISLHKKTDDLELLFTQFLKSSTIIDVALLDEQFKRLNELIRLIFDDKLEARIFAELAEKNGFLLTANQLYTTLKSEIKISKDKTYKTIESFRSRGLIREFAKYGEPNAPKKFFIYDQALKGVLTFKKNFARRFEAVVANELQRERSAVFYFDYVDFFLPDQRLAIVAIPFVTLETLLVRVETIPKELDIKKLVFVTAGFEYEMSTDRFAVEAVPFWQWAVAR